MIVKVPRAPKNGGSFGKLEAYITSGIEQAGRATDKGNWDLLTQYVTSESVLNALGEDVEKTIGVEIGNVASLDTAAEEMELVASRNKRVKNAKLHYILSWPEREVPSTEEIFEAARSTLAALGIADHQYIIAIHGNTDNVHAHIAVNRVHPTTYRAARLEWLHKTLHKAAREIEIEHGWSHDNGLFKVVEINGAKFVVPNSEYVDPDLANVKGGAAEFETWHGEQSLETWCRGEPAKALKAVLAADGTSSWDAVHHCLAKFGLELKDSGGGGMRVQTVAQIDSMDHGDAPISVSASKAFRFLKRPELESRLGPFSAMPQGAPAPEKTYKRDPTKRLERKLERRALRDALHERFKAEQKLDRVRHEVAKRELRATFGEDDSARRSAIQTQYLAQRAAIKADTTLTSQQKQQAYMLAKLTAAQAKDQLERQITEERTARKALIPPLPTWRVWVEQKALEGDEAAISALRGMVYQEKRDLKAGDATPHPSEVEEDAITSAYPTLTDPLIRKVRNLVWKVHRNGTVAYNFKSGESGFIDAGEKLVFGREQVSDEALALTLQYAKDKWGTELRFNGGDAVFKARVARLANEFGIVLIGAEFKGLQEHSRKTELQRHELKTRQADTDHGIGLITDHGPRESVQAAILARSPGAEFEHAITQATRYRGRIAAHDERFIAQMIAPNKFVLHDARSFGAALPKLGETVTIAYKSGQPSVKARASKAR